MPNARVLQTYDRLMDMLPPGGRVRLGRWWYEKISQLDRDGDMHFMNHGLAPLDAPISLEAGQGHYRHAIQLYHHVATSVDLAGGEVLELGSGRGGGAAYLTQRFNPKSYIGIDRTAKAVKFCRRTHRHAGLSFLRGDAERLPFEDESFDIVINIEASGLWADPARAYAGVCRVLRPDGYFLHTDLRYFEQLSSWRKELDGSGLHVLSEEDITPNVARALKLDAERKERLIRKKVPRLLRFVFREFAGTTGAALSPDGALPGYRSYLNFILHKPAKG